jgi:hypothetical protein
VKKRPDRNLYRILDANFNRAKEGLRVCEDVCRYVWDWEALTRAFKNLRHELTGIMARADIKAAIEARHIQGDVGRSTTLSERGRTDIHDVFWANSQRVKESLRVLEEVTKLTDTRLSSGIKMLRYKVYALEQKALKLG